jgi:hypothetical protein
MSLSYRSITGPVGATCVGRAKGSYKAHAFESIPFMFLIALGDFFPSCDLYMSSSGPFPCTHFIRVVVHLCWGRGNRTSSKGRIP